MPVPDDGQSAFVYFLGPESSGAVMNTSDLHPFDINDTEKATNPLAVPGVAMAADLLRAAEEEAAREKESQQRKKASKEKKRRRNGNEEEDDEDEVRVGEMVKKEKASLDEVPFDAGDDEEDDEEGEDDEEEEASFLGGGGATRRRAAGVSSLSSARAALTSSRSATLVTRHLQRIHYTMQQLQQAAEAKHQLLSMSEEEVVRRIEEKLYAVACKAEFLERSIAHLDSSSNGHHHKSETELRLLKEDVQRCIKDLQQPMDIDLVVRSMVALQPIPFFGPSRTARQQRSSDLSGADPATTANTAFTDPLVAHIYRSGGGITSHAAVEPAAQVTVDRYYDQRRRHSQMARWQDAAAAVASSMMLSKSGSSSGGVPRVMERWSTTKMVPTASAAVRDVQRVKPRGFFSAKFSASRARMATHVMQRLERSRQQSAAAMQWGKNHGGDDLDHEEDDEEEDLLSRFRVANAARDEDDTHPASLYRFHETTATATNAAAHNTMTASRLLPVTRAAGETAAVLPTALTVGPLANVFQQHVGDGGEDGGIGGGAGAGGMASAAVAMPHGLVPSSVIPDPAMLLAQQSEVVTAGDGVALLTPLPPQVQAPFMGANEDAQHEEQEAQQRLHMAAQSTAYSVGLPSQESLYLGEEESDVDGEEERDKKTKQPESVLSAKAPTTAAGGSSWRESAKRVILEQLTLYLRGLKGRPVLLNKATFKQVAVKLLARAVQRESQRRGISLHLAAPDHNALFTKEEEKLLKGSVHNYIHRHFVSQAEGKKHSGGEVGGDGKSATTTRVTSSSQAHQQQQPAGVWGAEEEEVVYQ